MKKDKLIMTEQDPLTPEEQLERRLWYLRSRFYQLMETDMEQAIGMLEEAHQIAEQLGNEYAKLDTQHWLSQAIILRQRDFKRGLAGAVQAAVDVRQPQFKDWDVRVCIHQDLIYAYAGMDPAGYADKIEDAIDYMDTQITPDMQCRFCLQEIRAEYALANGRYPQAHTEAMRLISMGQQNHYQASAYMVLCEVACQQGNWQALANYADLAHKTANDSQRWTLLVSALMWQAVVARQRGEEKIGRSLYALATRRARNLTMTLPTAYFSAMVAYHCLQAQWEEAAMSRAQHLQAIEGHDAWHEMVMAQFDKCRLLALAGKLTKREVTAVRAFAQNLKDANQWLDDLAKLEVFYRE